MIFGDKSTFAIEYELDPDHGGAWLFGKVCYWVRDHQIGDYELGTSLRDVLTGMSRIVHDCGNRMSDCLYSLPDDQCYNYLDGLLYEPEVAVDFQAHMPIETPARFDIMIPIDVFGTWKMYLVESSRSAKILYKRHGDRTVFTCKMKIGEFDRAITEFNKHLEAAYVLEAPDSEA